MTDHVHRYRTTLDWTGDLGSGTSGYRAYSRDHLISGAGKPAIPGTSDPAFRGDPARWNPEELLVASLSACHMLFYLHLCAEAGVVVTGYRDEAEGAMRENADGSGEFTGVTLRPRVTIAAGSDPAMARTLHDRAHALCFIARSTRFEVAHDAEVTVAA